MTALATVPAAMLLAAAVVSVDVRPGDDLSAVRDRVRAMGKSGPERRRGVVVELADGTYRLDRPLELDLRDSGALDAPVVWRAKRRGGAVVSGAVTPAWRPLAADDPNFGLVPEAVRRDVVVVDVPGDGPIPGFTAFSVITREAQRAAIETPLTLYQGGRRLVPARWPQDGWSRVGRQLGTNWTPKKENPREKLCFDGIFVTQAGRDRLARWKREPDLWAHGRWYSKYNDTTKRVLGVDPDASSITVDMSLERLGCREGGDYHVVNAISEIDAPGEWAVDRRLRRLYVLPYDGSGAAIEVASAPGLVHAVGLSCVRFEGFSFQCAASHALVFENATNVQVMASEVAHVGGDGIRFDGGRGCRVEGCDLYDLGQGGVVMKGGEYERLVSSGHVAENNHIHHFGRVIANCRPGIDMRGVGVRAVNNLIHHGDQQGINFFGNDHYIGYNVLHDLCLDNDDAGVIYGYHEDLTMRGTVIEYNTVFATGRPGMEHVNAIYLDAWTSGCTVRGNLVNRAPLGVWASGGQATVIDGNVIMNCVMPVMRGDLGPACADTKSSWSQGFKSGRFARMVKNRDMYERPPWKDRYPKMLDALSLDGAFAHSALWVTITNNAFIGCGQLYCHHWKETGPYTTLADNEASVGDPGFTDYFGLDWTLRPDSPLRKKLGGDTRFDRMGLRDDGTRFSRAVKFGEGVSRPAPLVGVFPPPRIAVDLVLDGKVADSAGGCGEAVSNCRVRGRFRHRVETDFGEAGDGWRECSFSFVPSIDGEATLWVMGGKGELAEYDDFRATGAEIRNGDFEGGDDGWVKVKDGASNPLFVGGVDLEFGILGVAGGRRGVANFKHRLFQRGIRVRRGVKVEISFRARAHSHKGGK